MLRTVHLRFDSSSFKEDNLLELPGIGLLCAFFTPTLVPSPTHRHLSFLPPFPDWQARSMSPLPFPRGTPRSGPPWQDGTDFTRPYGRRRRDTSSSASFCPFGRILGLESSCSSHTEALRLAFFLEKVPRVFVLFFFGLFFLCGACVFPKALTAMEAILRGLGLDPRFNASVTPCL